MPYRLQNFPHRTLITGKKMKKFLYILSALFVLSVSSCELFPYGLWGDTGAVYLHVANLDSGLNITKIEIVLRPQNDDSKKITRSKSFPLSDEEMEITAWGIPPGRYEMSVYVNQGFWGDQKVTEVTNIYLDIAASFTARFDAVINYNFTDSDYYMALMNITDGFAPGIKPMLDTMSIYENGSGPRSGINLKMPYTAIAKISIDDIGDFIPPFNPGVIENSGTCTYRVSEYSSAFIRDIEIDGEFNVKVYQEKKFVIAQTNEKYSTFNCVNGLAPTPASPISVSSGPVYFDLDYSDPEGASGDMKMAVLLACDNASGRVIREYRTVYNLNQMFIDNLPADKALTFIAIVYIPDNDNDVNSGITGTFLDTSIDPTIDNEISLMIIDKLMVPVSCFSWQRVTVNTIP